jgi:chorismate mutase
MESEIGGRDQNRDGSLANGGAPELQMIVAAAHDELRRLIQRRAEITKRIGKIKQTIGGLCTLFGDDELGDHTRESMNGKAAVRRPGITQACRKVLMEARSPLTARNVCEQIQRRTMLDLPCSTNLVAAVTTVLSRLEQYGEARTVLRHRGARAWVWVAGVEDGSIHPVNSPVDSQVQEKVASRTRGAFFEEREKELQS